MAKIYYKGNEIFDGSADTSFNDVAKWLEKDGITDVDFADFTMDYSIADTNKESKAYLASTDWMAVREAETGTAMPADVKAKRAEARATVV